MDAIDRDRLARAYTNAWEAVKGWRPEVKPEPYGWFSVRTTPGQGLQSRVRAADLITGLLNLTHRLANAEVSTSSPLTKRI